MMIDIDHFKLFNDRYGHVAGDTCLRAVGETLSLVTLDDAVMVARYGGEEFALLLPALDSARGNALAEEARQAVEELRINHAEAACGYVTVSIGVGVAGAGRRADAPPISSRRPTARSMSPNAAAATTWSCTCRRPCWRVS